MKLKKRDILEKKIGILPNLAINVMIFLDNQVY